MATQIAIHRSLVSAHHADPSSKREEDCKQYQYRQRHRSRNVVPTSNWTLETNAGNLPTNVVMLIAYTTWLVSEVLDIRWEDVLRKAGIQKVISDWLCSRAQPGRSLRDVEDVNRGSNDSCADVIFVTAPHEKQESKALTKTPHIKRQLKTCLRIRDQTKPVPLRAAGCKGTRRSNGEETCLSVKWGCDGSSGSESSSGCTTPLEEVFLLEKIDLDSMGMEMQIVRDSRLGMEDDSGNDEEDEEDGETALCMKLVKRV